MYVFKENNNNKTNSSFIEGSHYQVKMIIIFMYILKILVRIMNKLLDIYKTSSNLF